MDDFREYLEQTLVAAVGDTTIKEMQQEEFKQRRNDIYTFQYDNIKIAVPHIFENNYIIN